MSVLQDILYLSHKQHMKTVQVKPVRRVVYQFLTKNFHVV